MKETLARIAQGVGLLVICAAVAWAAGGVTGVGGGSNTPAFVGLGDGGAIDPTAVHQSATAERKLGVLTVGSLLSGDGGVVALGGALTVEQIRRPSGALPIMGSPVAVDGGLTVSATLAVTGASTLGAVAETGQHTNTLVATSGSSYTDATMATGASIYQHQASTASYKAYECWKTDSVSEWICMGVSAGGGASPAMTMNGGTNHDEVYVPSAGGFALDVNGSRAQTSSAATTTFPAKVANTGNSGTCTLNAGTPSTCTVTVTAGAVCTCSNVGGTAAIALLGCAVGVSSTTLTVTSANGASNNVNIHCDR